MLFPTKSLDKTLYHLKRKLTDRELEQAINRIHYYIKIKQNFTPSKSTQVKDLRKPKSPKAYYFDTYEYARFFDENLFLDFEFGDVTHIPNTPSIVKSRPISNDNQNSILLNLDKARHFVWIKNDIPFQNKKNLLIGRGAIFGNHKNRIDFYSKYFHHPLCNLGQTNNIGDFGWQKPKISLRQHLNYKFILSLQGNDVATNLKWIMSSNSIAVMPQPTMETWFMEGTLEGGKHYIEIKPDYSDLEEQLNFYINHPEACLEIIKNAHTYCQQFWNKDVEDFCSFEVLKTYFKNSL